MKNIDDYIREQKRKGVKEIRWSKYDYALLQEFISKNGFEFKGNVFMGIRHLCKK